MSNINQMQNLLFNLRLGAKQLKKLANKCGKEENHLKQKCKASFKKNRTEEAKIHAENSIHNRNQALNYLQLSYQLETISHLIQQAIIQKKVSKNMVKIVKNMDTALKTLSVEKLTNVMDRFESNFQNLDVQASTMENTMKSTTTTSIPKNQVDELMKSAASEVGLELSLEMPVVQMSSGSDGHELEKKLQNLRIKK